MAKWAPFKLNSWSQLQGHSDIMSAYYKNGKGLYSSTIITPKLAGNLKQHKNIQSGDHDPHKSSTMQVTRIIWSNEVLPWLKA